jgi:hypothetical protein
LDNVGHHTGRRDRNWGSIDCGGGWRAQQAIARFDERDARSEQEARLKRQVCRIGAEEYVQAVRRPTQAADGDYAPNNEHHKEVNVEATNRRAYPALSPRTDCRVAPPIGFLRCDGIL